MREHFDRGLVIFFFSSRRRHTRFDCDWSSDVCSSDLSARESRASVACQYRAAACAEMFCTNLVCVWLMFNTLKVTQAEKQIYPQSCGKVKKASPTKRRNDQTSPGAGTGSVTGTGVRRGAVIT